MLKNTKVTVWSNFVPQCECWDSVNLTQRGPWHSWEEVSKSPPAHCSTSFAFLTCRRKFRYTLLKHHLLHIHPWRNKTDQTNVLPLPSLPSDVPGAHLGTLSVSRSSCSALALHPNQTDVNGVRYFSGGEQQFLEPRAQSHQRWALMW